MLIERDDSIELHLQHGKNKRLSVFKCLIIMKNNKQKNDIY